jgi:hypothetical protein
VIPTYDVPLNTGVPEGLTFWTPRADDLSEEGFGMFRGTWMIGRLSVGDARAVLNKERRWLAMADQYANDAEEFQEVASALESGEWDLLPTRLQAGEASKEFAGEVDEDWCPLLGLEPGVASLVAALAAVGGCFPAASCRAHPTTSWSPYPIVLAAIDEFRVRRLSQLIRGTGCGFTLDAARPDLIGIGAPSVTSFIDLAGVILDERQSFRRTRSAKAASRSGRGEQARLEI